jgi:hypothetical protein
MPISQYLIANVGLNFGLTNSVSPLVQVLFYVISQVDQLQRAGAVMSKY